MKSALVLLFLCALIVAVSCYSPNDEGNDSPSYPWYNNYSYQYMMCRMKCRQSCLEQGYWKGVCKQGACYCFGLMGPYAKANNFPMPNF